MLIGSTVSPFIITEILHKWILTTSQGKQKTGVCVRACLCACMFSFLFFLIKIFSVLIICTRCILRLIRYILLQFFYAYKMTILNNFLTPNCAIFIGFSGYPLKKKKKKKAPPPKKKQKKTQQPPNNTNPHSMLFSETNNKNHQKSSCTKKLSQQ